MSAPRSLVIFPLTFNTTASFASGPLVGLAEFVWSSVYVFRVALAGLPALGMRLTLRPAAFDKTGRAP